MGGYLALALAALEGDVARSRLATMVLGATSTNRGVREFATFASVAAPWTPPLQRSKDQGLLFTGLVVFGRDPDRPAVEDIRRPLVQLRPRHPSLLYPAARGGGCDLAAEWCRVPVVTARGSRDHVVSARRQAQMLRRLPRARGHTFPDAGHALLPERPAQVAELILEAAARRG